MQLDYFDAKSGHLRNIASDACSLQCFFEMTKFCFETSNFLFQRYQTALATTFVPLLMHVFARVPGGLWSRVRLRRRDAGSDRL